MRCVSLGLPLVMGLTCTACIIAYPFNEYNNLESSNLDPPCTVICGKANHCDALACLEPAWTHRYGNAEDNQEANGVTVDANGTIALVGSYENSTLVFDTYNAAGMAGFSSWFLATIAPTGTPSWAKAVATSDVTALRTRGFGVAITQNSIVTVGQINVSGTTDFDGFAIVYRRSDLDFATNASQFLGGDMPDQAVAVVADGLDSYVVGTMSDTAFNKKASCPNDMEAFTAGAYVVKYNEFGGCQWLQRFKGNTIHPTAIASVDASKNGVWITGTFSGTMELPGSLTVPLTTADSEAFLVHLDSSGMATQAFQFGATDGSKKAAPVSPMAMTMAPAGTLYLAGQVQGPTAFSPELSDLQTAAFVASFPSKGTTNLPEWSVTFPSGTSAKSGARATGITLDGDNLFVAGSFGETITTPSRDVTETISEPGAHIFLSRIRTIDQAVVAFHHFSGRNESYDNQNIAVAKAPDGVVLAGSWRSKIIFEAGSKTLTLNDLPNAMTKDAFVAKLVRP